MRFNGLSVGCVAPIPAHGETDWLSGDSNGVETVY